MGITKAASTHPTPCPQANLAMDGVDSREVGSRGVKEPGQAAQTVFLSPGRHGKRLPAGLSTCMLFLGKVLHSIIHVNST